MVNYIDPVNVMQIKIIAIKLLILLPHQVGNQQLRQRMILNTKSLNELIRKIQQKPEIQTCFLVAKNNVLLSHHSKDNALYSSVSSLFNDSQQIIKLNLCEKNPDDPIPLEIVVKLQGITIIMKQAGGYYTFGCVVKSNQFAVGRMIFREAWKDVEEELKLVAASINFA